MISGLGGAGTDGAGMPGAERGEPSTAPCSGGEAGAGDAATLLASEGLAELPPRGPCDANTGDTSNARLGRLSWSTVCGSSCLAWGGGVVEGAGGCARDCKPGPRGCRVRAAGDGVRALKRRL